MHMHHGWAPAISKEPTSVMDIPDTAPSVRGSLRRIYQAGSRPFAANDLQRQDTVKRAAELLSGWMVFLSP